MSKERIIEILREALEFYAVPGRYSRQPGRQYEIWDDSGTYQGPSDVELDAGEIARDALGQIEEE